jgi:hypothetical protein
MRSQRWGRVFVVAAESILRDVLIYQGINPNGYQPLYGLFIAESIDPNVNRKSLLDPWIVDFAKGY